MRAIPDAFIFMKVGDHAHETWEQILARKSKEYQKAGKIFWGYGGAACHPLNQVQPFVSKYAKSESGIYLLMEPVISKANPAIEPATEYSVDGKNWLELPPGINVTGSKFAFVLGEIKPGDLMLDPERFAVGVGNCEGRSAGDYLRARVDKACLVKSKIPIGTPGLKHRAIKFSAPLIPPYAVFVR